MFCNKCGTQIPDGAKFCLNCGQPLIADSKPDIAPVEQWEICKIKHETKNYGILRGNRHRFYAEAVALDGTVYIACKADEECKSGIVSGEPDYLDSQTREIHDEFVAKLVREGWEATDQRGTRWYSLRLRRKITESK
jgi:hypothetical protein